MPKSPQPPDRHTVEDHPSRRGFIKGGGMMLAGGAIGSSQLEVARGAHAFGSDTIDVGLIGCGGRGTGAAIQALSTAGGDVRLTALADVFENSLQTAYRSIKGRHPDKVAVGNRRFVGLEGFRGVLESDVDVVILATPPGFRPQHLEAAVAAGKHVFMEKPVATDPPGVRRVLAAGEVARAKGLAVAVGLQRRHEFRYRDCVERLKDGAIGEPIYGRVYWNGSGVWVRPRKADQTELEYQLRNWYYFNWLSGDHINEQHIHNLDVINWLLDDHPAACQGQGGRAVRNGIDHGQIFDHHMAEYAYANGFRLLSQCRHIKGCWSNVSEHVHGTAGYCDISKAIIYDLQGGVRWQSQAKEIKGKGWQQEHHDLFASLRRGEAPSEVEYAARSTMTAIMGRLATYGGKTVKWGDAIASSQSLADTDELRTLDDAPPVRPDRDGRYPIPIPGRNAAT